MFLENYCVVPSFFLCMHMCACVCMRSEAQSCNGGWRHAPKKLCGAIFSVMKIREQSLSVYNFENMPKFMKFMHSLPFDVQCTSCSVMKYTWNKINVACDLGLRVHYTVYY